MLIDFAQAILDGLDLYSGHSQRKYIHTRANNEIKILSSMFSFKFIPLTVIDHLNDE